MGSTVAVVHWGKVFKYGVFYDPYFPVLGPEKPPYFSR